jgi:hypothetical protein
MNAAFIVYYQLIMNCEYIFHVLNMIAIMEGSKTEPKVIDLTSTYQSCAMEHVSSKAPL